MANLDYPIKFSDELYATKEDIAQALGTNLIDDVWQKTLDYRKPHRILLSLRNLSSSPFRVTLNQAMIAKINALENKLAESFKHFNSFKGDNYNRQRLVKLQYSNIVRSMVKKYNIEYSDDLFEDIYYKKMKNLSIDEARIVYYIDALKELEAHNADPINEDLLTRIYSILINSVNSFIFYRENEISKPSLGFIKEYTSAPVNLIEEMMVNLFDFVNKSEQSIIVKFAACYYSIKLIKPFEKYYDELAMLMSKMILAHGNRYFRLDNVAMYLPLEDIIITYSKRFDKLLSSVQKESDLTYILSDLINYIENAIKLFNNSISNFSKVLDKEETRQDEEVVKIKKEEPVPVKQEKEEYENMSIFQEYHEEEKHVEKKPIVKEKPLEVPSKEERRVVSSEKPIDKIAPVMNEREATKYEKYLLESDPRLKKGQAHFFARHCTVGMYYTIKQYKRMIGCVYETARTSMDDLVAFGYYNKEKIKNKFVYTPKNK